ncbi:MAG: toprim domain-containing protein [Magnetococcales bacterium]|nr:toprim domain-containing protein [Magnetococcales bacterium]
MKASARGRWPDILPRFGMGPEFLTGKHGPCPFCGGRDRFRFDDQDGDGTFICNQCGAGDGFTLAGKLLGLDPRQDFPRILGAVGDAVGNWKSGQASTWCLKSRDTLSQPERDFLRRRIEADKAARQEEEARLHEEAALRATGIWQEAIPADPRHPYLIRKYVQPHGIQQSRGALVVPVCDFEGRIWSLQFITPDGSKRFLSGGRKRGLFYRIGPDINPAGTLLLAEGFATAATLHEETGFPVLVAFDAGNLQPVAMEARRRYQQINLVVCCDNDRFTPGNPGLSKGRAAALASGARLLVPEFSDGESGSDFNDFMALRREVGHG